MTQADLGLCGSPGAPHEDGGADRALNSQIEDASAAASATIFSETGNPFSKVPLPSLSATRERPLFSTTRRPPVEAAPADPAPIAVAAAEPAAVEPERPPFVLIGTIVGGGRRIAVLFNREARAITEVREGEESSGWLVKSVSARFATAERNGRATRLALPRPGDPTDPGLAQAEVAPASP